MSNKKWYLTLLLALGGAKLFQVIDLSFASGLFTGAAVALALDVVVRRAFR